MRSDSSRHAALWRCNDSDARSAESTPLDVEADDELRVEGESEANTPKGSHAAVRMAVRVASAHAERMAASCAALAGDRCASWHL